jgi:hypothetical protein
MNFGLWPRNKKKMSIAERSRKQDILLLIQTLALPEFIPRAVGSGLFVI